MSACYHDNRRLILIFYRSKLQLLQPGSQGFPLRFRGSLETRLIDYGLDIDISFLIFADLNLQVFKSDWNLSYRISRYSSDVSTLKRDLCSQGTEVSCVTKIFCRKTQPTVIIKARSELPAGNPLSVI